MVERPLDDIVTVCLCGFQVIEEGVEIVGQIRALVENAGFSVKWGRVGFGDNILDQLGGGCRYKRIISPQKACLALEALVEEVEGVLPGPPRQVGFRLPVPLRAVVGKVVGEEEGGCGKCRDTFIGDWEAGPLGLLLCFLHCHDELGNLGVAIPVAGEFTD